MGDHVGIPGVVLLLILCAKFCFVLWLLSSGYELCFFVKTFEWIWTSSNWSRSIPSNSSYNPECHPNAKCSFLIPASVWYFCAIFLCQEYAILHQRSGSGTKLDAVCTIRGQLLGCWSISLRLLALILCSNCSNTFNKVLTTIGGHLLNYFLKIGQSLELAQNCPRMVMAFHAPPWSVHPYTYPLIHPPLTPHPSPPNKNKYIHHISLLQAHDTSWSNLFYFIYL